MFSALTKTNTLMDRLLHILFLPIFIFGISISSLSAQNNLTASYSNFNTVPDFLNICGEADEIIVTVSLEGGSPAERQNITANVQLFSGVELINFNASQSSAGVMLTNGTNPNNPVFSLPNLSPNGTTSVNIAFSIRANCAYVDTLAANDQVQVSDTWNLNYEINGTNFTDQIITSEYRDAFAVPFFTIDVENNNPPARVGDCFTREIKVNNSSLEGFVDNLNYENIQGSGIYITDLMVNGQPITFDKTLDMNGDTVITTNIDGSYFMTNENGDNDTFFDPNEAITITESYCVVACDDFTGSINRVWWGCNGEECRSSETVDFVTLGSGSANVGFTNGGALPSEFSGYCSTGQTTITFTNGGVEFDAGFATMIDIEAGINLGNMFEIENGGFRITGMRIAGVDLTNFSGANLLNNNLQFVTDPDGAGGLSDFDGDGFFDDLELNQSFEITAFYEFDCSNANAIDFDDECTNDFTTGFNARVEYTDACEIRQSRLELSYFRPTNSNSNFENFSDSDAFAETDVFFIQHNESRTVRFFETECNGEETFIIKVVIPENINLILNQTTFVKNGVTNIPLISNALDNDTLILVYDATFSPFLNGNYNLELAFQADCEATFGPTEFPMTFEFSCPACDCSHIWYCGVLQGPQLHGTAPPCSPDLLLQCPDGLQTLDFEANRTSLGYTDATYTTTVSPADANRKVAISCDEVEMIVTNIVGETPISNNLGVVISHINPNESDSPEPLFNYLDGTVRFVVNGTPMECPVLPTQVTLEVDTSFKKYTIDLSSCLQNLGLTLNENDSVIFIGNFALNPNGPLPVQFRSIPDFRAYGFSLVDGEEKSCDNFGENFTVATTQIAFDFPNNSDFPNGCEETTMQYRLITVNNGFSDFFPNEFRQATKVDSIVFDFDPAVLTAFDQVDVDVSIPGHPVFGNDFFDLPPLSDFPDGHYSANFDTLLQVPSLNEVATYTFNLRIHLLPSCRSNVSSSNGNNLYNFDAAITYFDRYYAKDIGDGSCMELINDEVNSIVAYEEPPFFTLTPFTNSNHILLGDTATWIVQHCNTSFESDAGLTWLAIEDPTSTVDVVSMEDVTDPDNPVPLDIQDYGTTGINSFAFTDGLLRADGVNQLEDICNFIRIKAIVKRCENVNFTARTGWNCTDYEADWNPELYPPCDDVLQGLSLTFEDPFLDANVTDQPADNPNICATSSITILLKNIDRGAAFDVKTQLILPLQGATFVPNSVEIAYPSSADFIPALADPIFIENTLQGQVFEYGNFEFLNNYLNDNGLPGFNVNNPSDSNEVKIRYSYQTDCNFVSGSLSYYNFQGVKGCGDLSNFEAGESFPLIINGAEPDLSKLFQVTFAPSSVLNPNDLSTLQINITNLTTTPTDENDFVKLSLPAGFEYQAGTSIAIQPMGWDLGEPEITTQNGFQILNWQMEENLLQNVTASFEFQINTPDLDCNALTQEVQLMTVSRNEVFCENLTENCFVETITSTNGTDLTALPIGAGFGLTFNNVISECINTNEEHLTINGFIFTNNQEFLNEDFVIELYNDVDQNGIVNGEPLINTFMISGDITVSNPLVFEFDTNVASTDICNLIFVIDAQNTATCGELTAILPIPQLQNAGETQTFCSNTAQTFTTEIGAPVCDDQIALDYTWTAIAPASEADFSDLKLATPTITFDHDGMDTDTLFYVVETERPNCGIITSDTVQIILAEGVIVADGMTTIAPGESAQLQPTILNGTPPLDFQWSPTTTLDIPNIENPTATPTETTDYTLIVNTENGCADTSIFTVIVQVPVNAMVNPVDTSICADANLILQASGGEIFEWIPGNNPTTGNLIFDNDTSNPVFSNGLPGGVYQYDVVVSLIDFPDETDTAQVTITIFNEPIADAGQDVTICSSEQTQLTGMASGGGGNFTYEWMPQPLFGQNTLTPIVQPTTTTEYTLTITDDNGCTAQESVLVTVENCDCTPATVTGISVIQGNCLGGTGSAFIQIDGNSSDFNFVWSPDLGIPNTNGNARNGLPVGGYSVTIFNGNDATCFTEAFVTIQAEDGAQATVTTTPAACNATTGSATLSPANFNYTWEDGNMDAMRTDLAPGNYFVTVTDPNNGDCENYVAVFIDSENPLSAEATILNNPTCGDSDGTVEINVTGGSGNYEFSWASPTNIQDGLAAGIYNILITDLGNSGCDLPFTFVMIDDVPPATVNITSVTNVSCFNETNGAIAFNVSLDPDIAQPTTTVISDGFNEFSNGTFSAGSYCVVVTDGNGCVAGGACFDIEQPDPIVISTNATTACGDSGGSVDVSVNGGTPPYAFAWENLPLGNDSTLMNQSNLFPDFYNLTVIDDNACQNVLTDIEIAICQDCDVYPPADSAYLQVSCGELAELCLDISNDNLSHYTFTDNAVTYTDIPLHCDFEFIGVYSLTTLFGNGNSGPYELITWPGSSYTGDSIFNSPAELVNIMNSLDPDGNWTLNSPFITGGVDGVNYGQMETLVTTLSLTSFIGFNPQFTPSAFALELAVGTHEVIALDTISGCSDTIFVEVICTTTDTLNVEIPVGDTLSFCFDNNELLTGLDTLFNACPDETFVQIDFMTDTTCVDIIGLEIGSETACFVYCDSLGLCDTTVINIDVISPIPDCISDTLVVGQINQLHFPLANLNLTGPITEISLNCPTIPNDAVEYTVSDACFCLTYEAVDLGSSNTCVLLCDALGNCDSVDICLQVLPGFIVTDTILIFDDATTYCLDTDTLPGNIISVVDICEDENGESVIFQIDDGTYCIDYSGITEGVDTACILLTDDLGNQFLTTFIITAIEITAEVFCDTIFINDPMIFYPDTTELPGIVSDGFNDCENAAMGNVNFYVNPIDYSVEYQGLALGEDTACIILCDDLGFCDTTLICMLVQDTLVIPIAEFDRGDTTQTGTPVVIDIKGNDYLIGGIPQVTIVQAPTMGEVVVNLDCSVTYIPEVPICDNEDEFIYQVCLDGNPQQCDTALVRIYIECLELTIFNAVSPNNDGFNDVFWIGKIESFTHHLEIYNRWGNKVFETDNYTNRDNQGWPATWATEDDLPDGTYYYLLEWIDDDGEEQRVRGYIEVFR
jgi:gliding motility-associated-like protein